jgi:hypothetical protein
MVSAAITVVVLGAVTVSPAATVVPIHVVTAMVTLTALIPRRCGRCVRRNTDPRLLQ